MVSHVVLPADAGLKSLCAKMSGPISPLRRLHCAAPARGSGELDLFSQRCRAGLGSVAPCGALRNCVATRFFADVSAICCGHLSCCADSEARGRQN